MTITKVGRKMTTFYALIEGNAYHNFDEEYPTDHVSILSVSSNRDEIMEKFKKVVDNAKDTLDQYDDHLIETLDFEKGYFSYAFDEDDTERVVLEVREV